MLPTNKREIAQEKRAERRRPLRMRGQSYVDYVAEQRADEISSHIHAEYAPKNYSEQSSRRSRGPDFIWCVIILWLGLSFGWVTGPGFFVGVLLCWYWAT